MTISDNGGLRQTPVGNHIDAVSVDLSVRPPLVRVVGDARAVDDGPVVTAVIDRGPDSGRFWFFEATAPLTSPNVFAPACALYVSLAYLADTNTAPSDRVGQATAVVLRAEKHNVYLITADTPSASQPGAPLWTSYTLPFDTSLPWRVASQTVLVDGIERVLTSPSSDPLATLAEIRAALGSLTSIRIRGGQPDAAEMVLLRELTVLRVDAEAGDREPSYQ